MKLITALSTAWRNRALLLAPTALALTSDEYCAIVALRESRVILTASDIDGVPEFYLIDRDGQGATVSVSLSGSIVGAIEVGG